MSAKMTGGEALVAALEAHGTTTVFGIPGTHNLPVYSALARFGIRHVLTRHEQGAGFAADGWARAGGSPGVCLTTTGPAVLNAATAVAQAYSDSVPVLLISPGVPLRHPAAGNGFLHEVKDQRAALAAVVARSDRVTSVEEIPVAVAHAFATMTGGRPRPVHLEIPLDLLDETGVVRVPGPLPVPGTVPDSAALTAAARVLTKAQKPLIVAGGGASGAASELRHLAERLGAPVVTTANGKGVLPDDHPLAVGAGLHHSAVRALAADSDAVLAVGTELAPSDLWFGPLDPGGPLVRIDVDAMAATANAVPDIAVIADAGTAVGELLARIPAPDAERPQAATTRAAAARERLRAEARAEGGRWLGLTAALAQALGPDGVLVGDSTMACYYGALSNLPAHRPRSFLYPTGLGTLGYGLPAAIGAKLARPEAPVVALHGDGGVMFTVAELAAAAAIGLPLPVVVVDNGGYGEIRAEMRDRDDPVHAVDLPGPDFAALARSLGCHGIRVADAAALAAELPAALAADRPTLIHLPESGAH
jgi:acetolactate synthase-1/2/3 large subunit